MEMNGESQSNTQHYKCSEDEVVSTGKWLQLSKVSYQDPSGKTRVWESVSRTNRPANSDTDTVGVVAILKRTLRRDCFILIKQFRPPLKTFTVEFPGGLIAENETPAEAALRELREETGYIGEVKFVGPPLAVDPGISNNIMRMVTVEIDGDNSENLKPVQRTVDQGLIHVMRVPIGELHERLMEYTEQGVILDSRLQSFSLGLVKGAPKKFHLTHAESVDEK